MKLLNKKHIEQAIRKAFKEAELFCKKLRQSLKIDKKVLEKRVTKE